jgi:hypothetical protein
MQVWIVRSSSVEENVCEGKDIKAKAEFLGLPEDNTLKAGLECPILSSRAPELLIPFALFRCEAAVSSVVNAKTKIRNRPDEENGLLDCAVRRDQYASKEHIAPIFRVEE